MSITYSTIHYLLITILISMTVFLGINQLTTCAVCPNTISAHHSLSSAGRPVFRTFRELVDLEDLSYDADDNWSTTLSTPKGGFVWQKYNESMNEAWGVTMFHSIHCLALIRRVVQASSNVSGFDENSGTTRHKATEHGFKGHDSLDMTHIGHCFSYIAQNIMCSADDTIEPPREVLDSNGDLVDGSIDGEGYMHECRDSSLMWDVVARSEQDSVAPWEWHNGDTIRSVFGNKEATEIKA